MKLKRYRNLPHFFFYNVLGSLRGDSSGAVGIIGGADGPTAVYVARRRKPKQPKSRLEVQPVWDAVLASLRLCSLALLLLSVIVAAANHLYKRSH